MQDKDRWKLNGNIILFIHENVFKIKSWLENLRAQTYFNWKKMDGILIVQTLSGILRLILSFCCNVCTYLLGYSIAVSEIAIPREANFLPDCIWK